MVDYDDAQEAFQSVSWISNLLLWYNVGLVPGLNWFDTKLTNSQWDDNIYVYNLCCCSAIRQCNKTTGSLVVYVPNICKQNAEYKILWYSYMMVVKFLYSSSLAQSTMQSALDNPIHTLSLCIWQGFSNLFFCSQINLNCPCRFFTNSCSLTTQADIFFIADEVEYSSSIYSFSCQRQTQERGYFWGSQTWIWRRGYVPICNRADRLVMDELYLYHLWVMCLLAVLVIVKMWDTTFNVSMGRFLKLGETNCKAYLGTKCDVQSMCFLHHVCHTNYWRHIFLSFFSLKNKYMFPFLCGVFSTLPMCMFSYTFWYSRHSVFSALCMRVWGVCRYEIPWDLIYLQASVSVWCDRPTIWWT